MCRLLCPDLAMTLNEETGRIEIDLDFCKGCGICVAFCPKEAITMKLEK
jgi:pyruvate ferredoxin oxidoreductase delta subunit